MRSSIGTDVDGNVALQCKEVRARVFLGNFCNAELLSSISSVYIHMYKSDSGIGAH